jgi:glycosyltransferase involved in cell wall biosynthesis
MVLETVSALREAGLRVVVTVPADGPLVEEVVDRGGEVVVCATPIIRKSLLSPAGLIRLTASTARCLPDSLALIRRVDPDVIYVNTITAPLWLFLAKLTGRPSVCHVHEGETTAPAWAIRALNVPLMLADRLIVNSEFSLSVLRDTVPRLCKKAEVVYNTVPTPARVMPPRSDLEGPVRILFVGRLSPRKGPDVAIGALSLLRSRGVDATLDLVGAVFPGYEWFERELVERVRTHQLEDAVHFHGFQRDTSSFTAAADIVVVPSAVEEPFGNTAVEALLSARPAVVSAIGGLPEAVSGFPSALLVEPGSATAIADAVESIVSTWNVYRAQAVEDSSVAARRYSFRNYARAIVSIVEGLRS